MAPRSESLSFRVPSPLRQAIKKCAEKEGKSQSDFLMDAVTSLVDRVEQHPDLILGEDYRISKDDPRMMAIRVPPEFVDFVKEKAPRMYQRVTPLLLWAAQVRINEIAAAYEEYKKKKQT